MFGFILQIAFRSSQEIIIRFIYTEDCDKSLILKRLSNTENFTDRWSDFVYLVIERKQQGVVEF